MQKKLSSVASTYKETEPDSIENDRHVERVSQLEQTEKKYATAQ